MTDGTLNPTWETNAKLLSELWPAYEPTDAEKDLCRESLGSLDQVIVREAIRAVRVSGVNDFKPPLSEIIHDAKQRQHERSRTTGDGRDYARIEAEASAERDMELEEIRSWDLERRKAAIDFARDAVMIGRGTIDLANPHRWTKVTRAVLVAVDWLVRNNPEKANAIRGAAPKPPPASALPPREGMVRAPSPSEASDA